MARAWREDLMEERKRERECIRENNCVKIKENHFVRVAMSMCVGIREKEKGGGRWRERERERE
jgi:hypothetical protein